MSGDDRIVIDVLGDSSTFSRAGKGIAYHLKAGGAEFLVDCGAPVISLLGEEALSRLDGVIVTHAHDDHRRWLSDLVLHQTFSAREDERVRLMASPEVLTACRHSLEPALSRTLSDDSSRVEDLPFERFVEPIRLGPAARFRTRHTGGRSWEVVDENDDPVAPSRARAMLAEGVQRPRLLYRDPESSAWVEPEAYYPFTDGTFYRPCDPQRHGYEHPSGLRVTPVKATAWHGPPTTSLLFEYGDQSVFFSSDTVYDPELWERLCRPRTPPEDPGEEPWAKRVCLHADINRFVERTWSDRRRERARSFYESDRVIVHDVAGADSPVHTHYRHLEDREGGLLLTHTPESFTARHPIAAPGKTYVVAENRLWERPHGSHDLYGLEADCFHKEKNRLYVGVEDPGGSEKLRRTRPGVFELGEDADGGPHGTGPLKLYRDLRGSYFPKLEEENARYARRPDGSVERRIYGEATSEGRTVPDRRETLGQDTLPVASRARGAG